MNIPRSFFAVTAFRAARRLSPLAGAGWLAALVAQDPTPPAIPPPPAAAATAPKSSAGGIPLPPPPTTVTRSGGAFTGQVPVPRQVPRVVNNATETTAVNPPGNPIPGVAPAIALPGSAPVPGAITSPNAVGAAGAAALPVPSVAGGPPPTNPPASFTSPVSPPANPTAVNPVVATAPAPVIETAAPVPAAAAAPATNTPVPRTLALPGNFPRPPSNSVARPSFPANAPAAARPVATTPARPPGPAAPVVPGAATAAETEENNAIVEKIKGVADFDDFAELVKLKAMPLDQFLDIYAKAAKRIVLRGQGLNGQLQVTFMADKRLPREKLLEAFDTVLALNQIATIPQGEEFVLVVPSQTASGMAKQFTTNGPAGYNEAFQYVTHIVQVKYVDVKEAVEVIAKFASPQNAQGIVALDSTKTIVLRDYQANVKRMLEVLEKIDVFVEGDYVLEVIPIKYGKVEEIYGTLGSVIGNGGGSGVTSGSLGSTRRNTSRSTSTRSGGSFNNPLGAGSGGAFNNGFSGQQNGLNQQGGVNGNRTGFQQRLNGVNRAGGAGGGAGGPGGAISELLETTSITPDPRSNSLIVYGLKKDIAKLKEVIAKVDTLLAQVLIEGIIMEVSLADGLNYGLSGGQRAKSFGGNPAISGGGSVNGNSSLNNVGSFLAGAGTNSLFPTGGGLSYFSRIGSSWDVTLNAIATDSRVSIIQQPRIQTTHATQARFFVGSTVPFQQGNFFGGGLGTGGGSSFFQRQDVGIDLSVTPYITPDGLVTMEVEQIIEEIAPGGDPNGTTPPTTNKREATSTVSVMSGESIMLGGYIRNSRSVGRSGVPVLKDIPLLGKAFSSNTKNDGRTELLVMIHPTVLLNPKEAADLASQARKDSASLRQLEHEVKQQESDRTKAIEKKEKRRDSKWWR